MYCIHCGKRIPDDSRFCPMCGKSLADAVRDAVTPTGLDAPAAPQGTPAQDTAMAAAKDAPMAQETAVPAPNTAAAQETTEPASNAAATQETVETAAEAEPVPAEAAPDGASTEPAPARTAPRQTNASNQTNTGSTTDTANRKGGAARPLILIVVIALVIVGAVLGIKSLQKTINLNDYVDVTFAGYDGYGTASYTLHTEAEEVSALYLDRYGPHLSQTDGLRNGDTIIVSWDLSEDDLEEMQEIADCKITAADMEVTVNDLEEVTTFDPFDGMTITFSGADTEGEAQIESIGSDEACQTLSYSIEPGSGLSNGDTVTVTVGDSDSTEWVTAFVEQYGKAPAATSQTYTVEGLAYYATSASEIPEDTLRKMQMRAKETFTSRNYDEARDGGSQEMTGYEYIGTYFLSARDSENRVQNKVYLVYKYRMHLVASDNRTRYEDDIDAYWGCEFDNILITPDGGCEVDLTNYHEYSGDTIKIDTGVWASWNIERTFRFNGYSDLDAIYADLVTSQADAYTSENNVEDVELVIEEQEEESDVLLPYEAELVDSDNAYDYESVVRYRGGNGRVLAYTKYWIKGQFDTLTFTLLPVQGSYWGGNAAELCIVDAETGTILESIMVDQQDIPKQYTVDISGVNVLEIVDIKHNYLAYLVVADATVTNADGESATLQYAGNIPAALPESEDHGDAVSLAAWSPYASTNYGTPEPRVISTADYFYIWSNTFYLDPGTGGNDAKAVYELDSRYQSLTFEYSPATDDGFADSGSLQFDVLDEETGEVLYTADITKSTKITEVTIDVTDVNYLAFQMVRKSGTLYNTVLINDAYLSMAAE